MYKTKVSFKHRAPAKAQRGAALFEALVGMLVMSIAIPGALLTLAHGVKTQVVDNQRSILVRQIRSQLSNANGSPCNTALVLTVPAAKNQTGSQTAQVQCTALTGVTVSLPGAGVIALDASAPAQSMTVAVPAAQSGVPVTVTDVQPEA